MKVQSPPKTAWNKNKLFGIKRLTSAKIETLNQWLLIGRFTTDKMMSAIKLLTRTYFLGQFSSLSCF